MELTIFPSETMAMTIYLIYKNKINNMGERRIHKIVKKDWHKYDMYLKSNCVVEKDATLQNNDNIRSIIT